MCTIKNKASSKEATGVKRINTKGVLSYQFDLEVLKKKIDFLIIKIGN